MLALTAAVACHSEEPPRGGDDDEAKRLLRALEAKTRKSAPAPSTPPSRPPDVAEPEPEPLPKPPASADGPGAPDEPQGPAPWIADDETRVGPPSPVSASPVGLFMHTMDGGLAFARLGRLPQASRAGTTPIRALPPGVGPFRWGHGPGLFQGYAYWISHGSLVRRRVADGVIGPLEILARDAHDGTRVGVPLSSPGSKPPHIPATVAYIVRPPKEDAPLVAKLWVEGAEPEVLTAEGNSTHSVSLVSTEDGVLAISVQARMAITPVHVRRIRFAADKPVLGEDVVVWVGGGIQPLTEMSVLRSGKADLWGFLPHERSITEFGLARLDITTTPTMDTATSWTLYPNGIDPAPVAVGHVCGEPVLLYATPETAAPESRQELVLRAVRDVTGERRQRIAEARAFVEVSLSEVPGGALAAWVVDEGTVARTVRCAGRPR
jgi:hypothetical protein